MTAPNALSRAPDHRVPCHVCGPGRRNPANRVRPVRAEWNNADRSISWFCNRCEDKGHSSAFSLAASAQVSCKTKKTTIKDNQAVAQRLWDRSIAIVGSPAESYLVQRRGITTHLPATLRYLPAYKHYPHSLIAACALAVESGPAVLAPPEIVAAIHLTELSDDGHSQLGKRMLGPVSGHPICLAPPNDGLGLVIAEGSEDALSVHQSTGLGAWAAGSASHLAKLAAVVPDYIECVTLMQDDDAAGGNACETLARCLLGRGFEVRIVRLGGLSHAA